MPPLDLGRVTVGDLVRFVGHRQLAAQYLAEKGVVKGRGALGRLGQLDHADGETGLLPHLTDDRLLRRLAVVTLTMP